MILSTIILLCNLFFNPGNLDRNSVKRYPADSLDTNLPIVLLSPHDEAKLETAFPLFSWTISTVRYSGITYTIKVVQVGPGQSRQGAIQANSPLFESHNIIGGSISYSVAAAPLEPGNLYAWQIIAEHDEQGIVGMSEIWVFSLTKPMEYPKNLSMYYELQNGLDAGYYLLNDDSVRFRFDAVYQDLPHIVIKDGTGVELKGWKLRKSGANLFIVALPPNYRQSKDFVLTVSDAKDRQYMLRFRSPLVVKGR